MFSQWEQLTEATAPRQHSLLQEAGPGCRGNNPTEGAPALAVVGGQQPTVGGRGSLALGNHSRKLWL